MRNFIRWIKEKLHNLLKVFFYKDGKISKTSVFLSLFSFALLIMWIFQSLFVGVTLLGWWLVPEFNVGAAAAVMSIFSALYIVNRSKVIDRVGERANTAEVARIKKVADDIAEANGEVLPSDEEDN